jgi:hypothetical protein
VTKWIDELDGISVAVVMGIVNAALAMLLAFGVNMTDAQVGTVTAFVNALLILVASVAHVNAKHTKSVIPAPPVDESKGP